MIKRILPLPLFFGLVLSPSVHAEIVESPIFLYDPSSTTAEASHFYLSANGRVVRVRSDQPEVLAQMERAYLAGDPVRVDLEDRGTYDEVSAVESLSGANFSESRSSRLQPLEAFELDPNEPDPAALAFAPTDVGTYENATQLFNGLRRGFRKNSQCYQRAHYWAYQMYQGSQINSMKVFLFFTLRYIRAYRYKWWFHVAPYVYVSNAEYVLDRSFTTQPLPMKQWTDRFMHNKAVCPVVRRYSDYENNQWAQYCYLAKGSMYNYQPDNIANMERGVYVNHWVASYLNHARSAAR